MRVFATSDLHVDFDANRALVEAVPAGEHGQDVLVVAGDVAHRLELLEHALGHLRRCFGHVVFTPGNHDLWVRPDEGDSVDRFHRILELCAALEVHTRPLEIGGIRLVPLFSWYEAALDGHAEEPPPARWADRRRCRWPTGMDSPAAWFASLNEPHLQAVDGPAAGRCAPDPGEVPAASKPFDTCRGTAAGRCAPGQGQASLTLTCSHFLPRRDLLPPVEFLRYPELPRVAGSPRIEAQLRAAGSRLHVFGHSHIRVDETLDGVRYVQQGLGYPRERRAARPVVVQIL
ncbi:MAG: metallophosphoesterase [Gemmatimonadota bacterium]